jgi:hypothetical protein
MESAVANRSAKLPAVGVSLLVNVTVLVMLSFVTMSVGRDEPVTEITTVMDDLGPDQFNVDTFSNYDQVGQGSGENLSMSMGTLSSAADAGAASAPSIEERVQKTVFPEAPRLAAAVPMPTNTRLTAKINVRGNSDKVTGGVQGTMDRVTHELRQSLEERQTLVMWLFDASGSLKDRRQAITERFETIYKQLGDLGKTDGLYTAVVSYGKDVNQVTKDPVADVRDVLDPIRKLTIDESGKENVFTAVRLAVDKWKQFKRSEGRWNKLMFIVTDERGDDADQQLEEVISLCKRFGIRVFVIGNAAVFGQRYGYVPWKYEDGTMEDIQVDQGPETAFLEGLELPNWGGGGWAAGRVSASYGPYALTRLCAETGGVYLVADDTHQKQFDAALMRDYTPDYRPMIVQQAEIAKNPAKLALVNAAAFTNERSLQGERFEVPKLEFRAYNDNLLKREITDAQMPVARVFYRIDELYKILKDGEKARPTLKEPRWRAAFDLAYGRLLAMHTRYDGYNRMLADMKVNPKTFDNPKDNHWRIVSSKEIDASKVGPLVKQRADQARMYLNRVIEEHPGTPWAMLASRELQTELGWKWEPFRRDVPGMEAGNNASEEEVARLLLAEEEANRPAPMKAGPAAPPRQKPNL